MKQLVAVMAGGYSPEFEVSVKSGAEVVQNLLQSAFEPVLVHVSREGWFAMPDSGEKIPVDKTDFSYTRNGVRQPFAAAFIAIHGTPAEDGLLPGYLDMLGVPHTTSGALGSSIAFHKSLCKELVKDCGVGLANSILVSTDNVSEAFSDTGHLSFPLFVKPNQNGSSFGISRVKNREELEKAIMEASRMDSEVLVEEAIVGGIEISCGIYCWKGRTKILPITEIVSGKGHDFFDYTAKYTAGEAEEITPARISINDADRVKEATRKIYRKVQLRGLARADFILADDKLWFLEVNTVPGLSAASIAPKMAVAAGLTLTEFFSRLLEEAITNRVENGPEEPDHLKEGPIQDVVV